LQAAAVLGLAGTLLPGLRGATAPIAFAAIILAACGLATAAKGLWDGGERTRRWVLVATFGLCGCLALVGVPYASYLAAAVPYYRLVCIVIAATLAVSFAFAAVGAWQGRIGWSLGCLVALALAIKCAHAEVYAPEWSYRVGQGPWGRAIGQWVPPRSPVYVFQAWPPDLAFAMGRSVRHLVSPGWLDFVRTPAPHYVLLLEGELEHWPKRAPAIEAVRRFRDAGGRERVLARTLSGDREPVRDSARASGR
jgi:hypothetical protein